MSLFKDVIKAAGDISLQRKKIVPVFVSRLNELMMLVGMPNAKLQIDFKKHEPDQFGIDEIQFMLDANKSGVFQLVQKAASGGNSVE